jgi:HTH-type transcriptional regulator/antitoxin HipB
MDQIARTPRQIGEAVRRQRRKLALTQGALGEKANLRQATISTVENGEPGTQLRTLFDLLAALDLELVVRQRSQSKPDDIEGLF